MLYVQLTHSGMFTLLLKCYLWNDNDRGRCRRCGAKEGVDKIGETIRAKGVHHHPPAHRRQHHNRIGHPDSRHHRNHREAEQRISPILWPPIFDAHGSDYIFDDRSSMFYEAQSDFFYDPKSKLYYGNKHQAYFRHDPSVSPPFVNITQTTVVSAKAEPSSAQNASNNKGVKVKAVSMVSGHSSGSKNREKETITINIRSLSHSRSTSESQNESKRPKHDTPNPRSADHRTSVTKDPEIRSAPVSGSMGMPRPEGGEETNSEVVSGSSESKITSTSPPKCTDQSTPKETKPDSQPNVQRKRADQLLHEGKQSEVFPAPMSYSAKSEIVVKEKRDNPDREILNATLNEARSSAISADRMLRQELKNVVTTSGKPICQICMRKFVSVDKLRLHEQQSELHKANLAKAMVATEATERKKAEQTQKDEKGLEKSAMPPPPKYKDRASQRRLMHCDLPLIQPQRHRLRQNDRLFDERYRLAPMNPDAALGEHNIGNQLLQKMVSKSKSNTVTMARQARSQSGYRPPDSVDNLRRDWKLIEDLSGRNKDLQGAGSRIIPGMGLGSKTSAAWDKPNDFSRNS